MKLDKRYSTAIDLRGRTTTGDPEGEAARRARRASGDELDALSTSCAARSSCRYPRRPRSRSTVSAPTACTARAPSSRCRFGRCASTS